MADLFSLSRDDSARVFMCCQQAAATPNAHARTIIEYGGKRMRVIVYEERDVAAIQAERAQAG